MKPCLICHNHCEDQAPSCEACGEGSFGAADGAQLATDNLGGSYDASQKPPSDDAGKGKAPKPTKGKRGKGATSDAPPSDDAGKGDEE